MRAGLPNHCQRLLTSFGLRRDALVLLAPSPRLDRTLPLIGPDRGPITNGRHGRPRVSRVRHVRRRRRIAPPGKQERGHREKRDCCELDLAKVGGHRTGGAIRPRLPRHAFLDCRSMTCARPALSRSPTDRKRDRQTIGGRLMRSGPRPLSASSASGRSLEALLDGPRIRLDSPATATSENSPQQFAALPSSPVCFSTVPSSWCR